MISADNQEVGYWVRHLNMQPHPEGGYYREVYRSNELIPQKALPARFKGDRQFCTAIYYLLKAGDFSSFHRIKSDEVWHFYVGGPLEVVTLNEEGARIVKLGRGVHQGEYLQYTVPAGVWFAARPAEGTAYTLAGCTVSPAFEFIDLELGVRSSLLAQYPQAAELITTLTHS